MSVYDKLTGLGISLLPVTASAAMFVPFVRTGNVIFVSGHIARQDGQPWVGQLGAEISTAQGHQAAASRSSSSARCIPPPPTSTRSPASPSSSCW